MFPVTKTPIGDSGLWVPYTPQKKGRGGNKRFMDMGSLLWDIKRSIV